MASVSTSNSNSNTISQSESSSFLPNYSEEQLLEDFASHASAYADQMYQWGMSQLGNNQSLVDSMINEGDQYASPDRIKADMGMAESGVMQAGDNARKQAMADLQKYGIDPSSGRYAALDAAERVKTAAAAAGAGNQQRMATEATGRSIRNDALNASIANENAGASINKLPADYLQVASSLKYPPLGNQSQSASQSNSVSSSVSQATDGSASSKAPASGSGGTGSVKGLSSPSSSGQLPPMDPNGGDPYYTDPFGDAGSSFGGGNGVPYQDIGGLGTDPNGNYPDSSTTDPFAITPDDGWGSGSPDLSGVGAGFDFSGGDFAQGGAVPGQDGAIPEDGATSGGFVSQQLSPSGGQQVDDVPARLNADEFVIPRDVAMWKGQEFFQKLIQSSRQARTGAPAKPTKGGQPQGQSPQGQASPMVRGGVVHAATGGVIPSVENGMLNPGMPPPPQELKGLFSTDTLPANWQSEINKPTFWAWMQRQYAAGSGNKYFGTTPGGDQPGGKYFSSDYSAPGTQQSAPDPQPTTLAPSSSSAINAPAYTPTPWAMPTWQNFYDPTKGFKAMNQGWKPQAGGPLFPGANQGNGIDPGAGSSSDVSPTLNPSQPDVPGGPTLNPSQPDVPASGGGTSGMQGGQPTGGAQLGGGGSTSGSSTSALNPSRSDTPLGGGTGGDTDGGGAIPDTSDNDGPGTGGGMSRTRS